MSTQSKNIKVGAGSFSVIQRSIAPTQVSVLASPAPTVTSFSVSQVEAKKLRVGDRLTISASPAYTADEASGAPVIQTINLATGVITVSPAFGAAPSAGPMYVLWHDGGATDGGIVLSGKTTTQDQEVDQEVDPVGTVITSRATNIKIPMAEATLENFAAAMGVTPSGTAGSLKIGSFAGIREDRVLLVVPGPAGTKRHIVASKCVNQGTLEEKSEKGGKSVYTMDYKVYLDTDMGAAALLDILDA